MTNFVLKTLFLFESKDILWLWMQTPKPTLEVTELICDFCCLDRSFISTQMQASGKRRFERVQHKIRLFVPFMQKATFSSLLSNISFFWAGREKNRPFDYYVYCSNSCLSSTWKLQTHLDRLFTSSKINCRQRVIIRRANSL